MFNKNIAISSQVAEEQPNKYDDNLRLVYNRLCDETPYKNKKPSKYVLP